MSPLALLNAEGDLPPPFWCASRPVSRTCKGLSPFTNIDYTTRGDFCQLMCGAFFPHAHNVPAKPAAAHRRFYLILFSSVRRGIAAAAARYRRIDRHGSRRAIVEK